MVQIRYVTVHGMHIYLPNGFRFIPSESELVLQYLSRRMLSIALPLPDYIYPQIDLRLFDPWDLPGEDDDDDDEKYYFTTVGAIVPLRGRNLVRPTPSGVWKMRGAEEAVISEENNQQVGIKRVFNFVRNNNIINPLPVGPCVSWTMYEYRLVENQTVMEHLERLAETNGVEVRFGEYYVVKIERKVVRRGRRQANNRDERESFDMSMEEGEDSS